MEKKRKMVNKSKGEREIEQSAKDHDRKPKSSNFEID